VRIDSCDQDCATSFYATGEKSDQFDIASKSFNHEDREEHEVEG